MSFTRKSGGGSRRIHHDRHRLEHWYRDNQVYFITSRCRDRYPAFAGENAKAVFWDRFDHYTEKYGFTPWITSLIDNHYHTIGYLRMGDNLGPMMQRLHGSVAKMVNDLLPERRLPFWCAMGHADYFDGCIRNEDQARRTYRYVLFQSVRHGIVSDWHDYPHTRINVEMEQAIRRATELKAYLHGVRYKRYEDRKRNPPR